MKKHVFALATLCSVAGLVHAQSTVTLYGLIDEGVSLFQNPWGSPLFGATFFSITGLHLLHVTGGVIAIAVVSRGFLQGKLTAGHVEATGLYWHFVDLVWMFVVPLVYLLNIAR